MSDEKKATIKQALEAARQKLMIAIKDLGETDWEIPVQSEGEKWTVLQMLRHLQDAQKGLTGQLERLLADQETVPHDFDVDRWNKRIQQKTEEAQMGAEQAIANLEQSLSHLMSVVDSISEEGWGKKGWQSAEKRELSTEEFVQVIANHEAMHAGEIESAVKTKKP